MVRPLRMFGQEHMARWLEKLEDGPRGRLLGQLAALDFSRLGDFRMLLETPPTEISFSDVVPAPVEAVPVTDRESDRAGRVVKLGVRALEADRVAVMTVAGGHGTRLGYDHPKGMYPISPIRQTSLFGLLAEQILAGRRRYGAQLPWLIMTSPSNDAETREYFGEQDHFGLGADTVRFFPQQTNPILSEDGGLLLAEEDRLLVGPDGHGGMFEAVERAGLLEMLRSGGWDLISYSQVDNPLVTAIDPRFLGHHVRKGAEFSCKVVGKRDPEEGLGIAVLKAGRPAVIEYVDVPDEVSEAREPSGNLRFLYGSIAIHVVSLPLAERVAHHGSLPWHLASKTYEVLDEEGRRVSSDGCVKFERFVFDALTHAHDCAFVEVRRGMEFSPVKNAEGEDSPATARAAMQRKWLRWLQEAGASVRMPADLSEPLIEISPLYAASAEELKGRIEPGWEPSFPLLLEP